jgi:hypothetical protein
VTRQSAVVLIDFEGPDGDESIHLLNECVDAFVEAMVRRRLVPDEVALTGLIDVIFE